MAAAEHPFDEREQVCESAWETRERCGSLRSLCLDIEKSTLRYHIANVPCNNSAVFLRKYSKSPRYRPLIYCISSDIEGSTRIGVTCKSYL